jgi:hypothetical protein
MELEMALIKKEYKNFIVNRRNAQSKMSSEEKMQLRKSS